MTATQTEMLTDLQADRTDDLIQLVSFRIGAEEFGVDILNVQEINRMTEITRVPKVPDYVEGVINLRGKVIPVIDLRKRLDLDAAEYDKSTRIVVADVQGRTIGLIVDAVSEVLRIPGSAIEPPPELVTRIDQEYVQGVAKLEDRLLMFLDLSKVVDLREMAEVSE